MPFHRPFRVRPFRVQLAADREPTLARCVIVAATVLGASRATAVGPIDGAQPIRSRQVELQYKLDDAGPDAEVELWYMRDRGDTWQRWGIHKDHARPILFEAPAEGLYGFLLIVRDKNGESSGPPDARTPPQRRVFIDYTPPLAQWDSVEPAEAFASRRIVHLRWTAHDAHLPGRPISLSCQSSIDQTWRPIELELPNSGQYDWTVPVELAGQVTLKLAVRDLGGHVVERLYGPVPIDRWMTTSIRLSGATSRPESRVPDGLSSLPAGAATRPADTPYTASLAARRKAEQLWSRGSWHAENREYAVAAERFREALEACPTFVPALYDLGAIHYLQKDYDKAIAMFNLVLAQDAGHQLALRGIHESYIAQKQYGKSYEILTRLARLDEKDAKTWLDLGDVLFMMDKQAEAREVWTRAMNVDPSATGTIASAKARLSRYGVKTGERAGTDRPKR